ncbi:uncharacterized protein LOC127500029 isoform X45 [Ctenopharyngodon idella]|uniref:uncharacterized protein LOC127500029 isoform X45 n=1 Tax=Ctenopharyngodon idella TaxID=7959 RepID=UPI00222E61DB|nr:uncharacterized protein LOC127500029 isoform X45 [Ctenopharyngodon idella]
MSEKQSERSDSVSVTSDHSKGGGPNFSEETPSAIESERSDLSSSVSVKSDRSKGGGPNFREETPSATERSDSDVSSSVSVKSNRSKDGEGPNFREETPSATERHFISVRSDSDVSSSVSVKSNRSKDGEGPNFREETPSATESVRSVSHVSSSVSVKSDRSKGGGPNFREETPSATESVRSDSDVSSSVSVKSNRSKDGEGPNFREETPSATERHFISLHVSSSVSVKSNRSKDGEGPNFREETPSATERKKSFMKSDHSKGGGPNSSHRKTSSTKRERSGSVESSLVSMRSDRSKDGTLPSFNEKTTSTKSSKEQNTTVNIGAEIVRWESLKVQKGMNSDVELASFLLNRIQYEKKTDFQSYRFKKFRENLIWVFQDLENKIIVFLKNELERFKKILKKENTQYFVQDFIEDMCSIKEAALDITLHFLKIMKQHELADTLKDELVFIHQRQLKSNLKKKYQCVFEGIAKQGDSTLLNSIYTDLYITQGGSEQVNTQHEVRQIEISRRAESQEIQIECTNLFESPEQGKEIRTVLTKGVAGIGKSISVQKFILDWAEEKENQDISFIFPLPFREMNLKEEEKQSLMNLVSQFFPEVKGLNLTRNDKFKVLFILDGLDECRLPLNFKDNETWRDVSSPASLDVLLTNLIRGNLLPSALIWITTRPAAASRIPQDCIDRVTEVRGFNDAQKEEYFNKRFTDKKMAEDIIDHVKKSKSLFIMCHIPVFCWISATVLQNILEEKRNNDVKNNQADDTSETLQESNTEDTPKTLTQMYTHFLRFQIQQSRSKYDGEYTPDVSWDKDAILSLGKLAFHQLERNNLIFYDTDLEACGIDASKALVYSGMCTQIFKEETGIILGTMYCFVHMSIQEFIAALYAHLFLDSNKKNVFDQESTEQRNKNEAMIDLLKTAVDKALTSEIGHLDLFLRFLLGLSLESNHPLLRGLLTQQDSNDQSNKDIVKYIKQKLGENLSPERSINLFYCLNELNEKTLVEDIQTQLREGSLSSADLSPAQWSAVAFVLLTSEKELENFELQEFKKSDECLIRLSAVIKTSKRALLNDCNLTDKSCSALATVLGSDTNLKELNMNNNNLQDSGVALLCTGLKSVKCKLETLWLNKCDLTKESCSALASVLSSDSSSLKDLELSNNNLQDSGVKLLCDGLKNNRKLEKIRLSDCGITEEGYKALASALRSNPLSHLIELDLTGNDPGQSGVKELSNLLQDPDCQLKMSSDSSSLKNLELSNNNLQDSGVKPPCDGLKNNRKLEKIRFLGPDAEEACKYLTEDLHIKNLLLLSELNLSRRELGDTQVNQIAALLKDKHCTLNTLKMNNNSITAEGCAALTSAFNSNPSNLIELDLSGNKLGNSGIEEICPLLENTQCRLMKLKLSDCSITEEGYKSLASALRSNPSHLTELDLTGNDPGQSGVKELNDLLQEEHCKLKSRFLKIPAAQEACEYLTNVLSISPLLLTELDLSEDKLGDLDGEKLSALLKDSHSKVVKIKLNNCEQTEKSCSVLATVLSSKTILKELNLNSSRLLDSGVKEICEGLKNPVCKLEILKLSDCSISEEGYKALASALRSNPSHLIELDLTGNDPGQSGVKELDDLLQDQNCQLKILTFLGPIADEACKYLTEDLHIKNPLLLRELILSGHELGDTRVNQIAALLQDKHCKLYTLMLCNCGLTEESCLALATVLTSNSSLKELDISSNNLQDSGVKKLQNALENTNCTLEKLRLSDCSITEEGYKALASALRSNPSHLIELDLTGNDPGQSGVKELDDLLQDQNCQLKILTFLGPIADEACKYLTEDLHIKNPLLLRELNLSGHELGDTRVNQIAALLQDKHCKLNTLMLCNCGLTEESCLALATVLTSNSSLKELDISSNNLQDSGVKKLQNALENTNCTLEKLRLSDCSITEEGYKALASALRSNPSHLIELDLTGNDPGQSGVKELDDLLQDQNCQLKILTFLGPIADEACKYLTEDLHIKNPLLLRELNLSGHELGDTRVNQIAALLQDKHCKLNTLMLCNCGLTEESCLALATVLTSNSSLKELDISSNNLQDSGVKKLQNALENTNCTLEKLRLSDCSITEEGYKALASALRSNPSHLIELDLTGNDPGQSGVKELDDLLQDENCELKTLRFLSPPADEACQIVNRVLCENLLLLRELNLSEHKLGPSGLKKLAAVLPDKHCKLNTLILNNSNITDEDCRVLTEALNSNPSNLTELNLSRTKLRDSGLKIFSALFKNEQCQLEKLKLNCSSVTAEGCSVLASAFCLNLKELELNENKLGNSGVTEISTLLGNSQCTLKILRLSDCSITEEGYKALASALRSNPSHLIELDLTGNDPGQSGVKELDDLLRDQKCQLNTLRFLGRDADEACQFVTGIVVKNPLLLRELNLSERELGDRNVKQIAALLQDKHCTVKTLQMNNNSITAEGCAALTSAFNSNPSNLIELDLSGNKLGNSGMEKICLLLKKTQCKMEKLKLSDCSITEEGYKALASALRSNPSHLTELDLTGNDPGQSGVKELNNLLQDEHCSLKSIKFLKSTAAMEVCEYLTKVLGKSPLLLTELDLSEVKLGDLDGEKFSALLMDSHSKVEKIKLNNCKLTEKSCSVLATVLSSKTILKELNLNNSRLLDSRVKEICEGLKKSTLKILKLSECDLTEESCSALASVLSSDSSYLKDLDLSNNNLQDSVVKLFSDGLKNNCKLEKLRLSDCSITEEGYKALASALRSNPSHLIELDLTGNDPGQSGVKELNDLLQNQNCQLKTLRFLGPAADEACQYLIGIMGKNPLILRELNLSECELKDTRVHQIAALLKDKHCKLNTLILNNSDITAEDCCVLTEALNTNPSNLTELNLSGTKLRDSGMKIFSTLFENEQCRLEKLKIKCISITAEGCAALTSAFNSNPSNLIELDLSGNKLGNSGVTQISTLLGNSECALQILRLSICSITEEGYKALASALRSNPSHLIELDLTGNDPGQSGVKELDDLLQDQNCQLKTLRFLGPEADKACQYIRGIVGENPLLLRALNLSERKLRDTRVNQIAALLKDKHCTVNTLMLNNNSITAEGCVALTSAFNSNPSNLKELDLSGNKLGNSGIEKICHLLENIQCRLEKLKLSDCSISKEGYKALASALRSNPSHLIELDLTGNDPGQSGVKELHDLLHDEHCKLTIRFLKSPAALEACEYLTKVLVKSPLLLTELDLSEDKLGDLDGEKLSALLMDSHSKVEKIKLNNCEQTEKSCSVLATVLSSKTILKELNLNNSRLLDSGVREICEGLKNPVCELEILKLSDCSITEEGYKALASALRSNPSHLIELDLTGNDPGQSGVKELNDLLQNQNCQLKTLRFLGPAADEACQYLIGIMGKNPLILRELNLSECELKDTRVHQIAALLKDKHCKLNTLILNNSDITAEDCCVLTEALNTNPSNLTELNLSGTKLRDSGMKIFSTLFENEQCRLEKLKIKCISITAEGCAALTSAFNSNPSNLIELDLSGNKLGNSGVTQISTLLGNSECALQILRLSICSITEEGYKALASALRSNPSHLIELDLTGNDPGQSGVKELDDLLQDQNCQLKTLRFLGPEADKACQYIRGIVGENPLLLRALNLSERKLRDTRVNQIAALLKDKHCTVNTLMLNNNSITAEGCVALTSAFNSNPSNLKELDLSGNKLRNLGIKKICHLLENIQCRLEKLKLSDCSISKEGYKALASALRSNPSHLIELDLTGNDPGQSGVKELHDLLHDEHCKLTIRFLKSPAALEACEYLTKVLVKSPLLLTELDLSEDKLGDLDGEKLSALLMDSHSKVEKIKLNNCEQTEKSCSVLATVLSSKTILKELNLNNSRLLDSGVREICEGLKNPVCELEILKLSDCSITEEGYKALASALRSNPSHLIELDLTGNDPGQSGVKELDDLLQDPNFQLKTLRLLQSPNAEEACKYLTEDLHIKNLLLLKELNLSEHELGDTRVNQIAALLKDKHCKLNTLMMHNCGLTEESCSALATVLTSNSSLKELDISNNNLQDSGVNKLQNALENTNCTLEKLRLSDCNITEEGYKALASALRSNSSHLIELDLTGNDPGQSGVKELNDLLQDPECQLKTLRFLGTEADKACQYVRGIVGENPLLLRDLNLSGSKLGDTQVNQIAALLQDKHCTVNTLMLNNNSITAEGCAALTSAFNSNPSNLIELDLSGNKLGNSGIKKICHLLKNTQCRLEKLKLSDCSITEEGYKDLVSALRSNPSHLIELDLTGNDPGRSGVKELDDLLQVEHCSLKTIRFLKSPAAQEACEHLTKVLGKSPLLLTELDLSEDKLGDLDGVKLSDLLMDSHSKVEKIKLNNCEQTEKSCSVLATVLSSKTILKELNLNNSRLLDSGVKEICEGLKKSTLKILKLSECSIREEGYKALASALRSNPSHLIELDLTGNDPGQSGVEHLINVQKTLCHSLKTLRILQSPAADEACQYVREILGKNPLFLNELNLSGHKLGDTRVNQIAALLQDKHCTVNTLILRNCGLTEESCSALAAVLRSNSSLKELDISKNNLQNSGVKKLQNGLEHKNCTLEKLRLSECSIREEGYKALASALRSNPSHLIELDLTGNDPGQSGVKELDDLLQDENCELKNLRILRSPTAEEACKYLTELLGKNPLLLRELNLSGCELGDTRVNQIAALLQDKHCQFNTLTLCGCSITENQCNTLTKALFPNLSHLRELDLSGNQLKNTGAKHLSGVLKDSRCQLERLRLRGCDMTDKGCSAVTSALKSNPSHLRELDLSGNEPGDSGFKDLSDLLKNPQCKLENLQLRGCHMTDEGCSAVTSALKSNPSHLRELDLSGNKLGDSGFKNLSDLLKNPQCKLENLQLCKCNIQEKQCISLTSALKSNPSHLRELNLSGNVLRHTRVKHFYDLLKDSRCKLERLRLRSCDITAEDCSAVTSALKSDPSHLRELDLSGNELGDSGVDNLGFVLSSSQCKLEKLHLCSCSITEKQCLILTQHLCYNLSHLRELDFSGNQIENKGVNHLCEVLMNPRCKLERLSLNECGITDVSSLAQSLTNTKALQFLKELDLSKNNIGSSRQQLIDLIKDSSCNLSLEKEGWSSWNTAANVFSGIGGLFTWSKAQEEPVKSTAQEKPPSDERSSEGKLEEGEKQEFLV